jgi:hypothetical protein
LNTSDLPFLVVVVVVRATYTIELALRHQELDLAFAELREMKMQPALERALGPTGLLKA